MESVILFVDVSAKGRKAVWERLGRKGVHSFRMSVCLYVRVWVFVSSWECVPRWERDVKYKREEIQDAKGD